MGRSLTLPTRFLKVYTEALTGFSHIFSAGGLSNTLLSQGYVLEKVPTVGMMGRAHIPRVGEAGEGLQLPESSLQVNQQSLPLNDLLQLCGLCCQAVLALFPYVTLGKSL